MTAMTARPRPGPGSDAAYPALKELVIARTGHHYYADKDDLLFDRLARRFKACGREDARAYLDHLADARTGAAEWAALEAEITIGETFFFRYAEQFAALRETILPGLIAARAEARTLRVWSAGCSTGAEPYSIAILLHELLGEALPRWRISITGTDISHAALGVARAAEYGRWALRTLPPEERQRYFVPGPAMPGAAREGSFTLRAPFRRMVGFEAQNLMSLVDASLPARFDAFDLILCRNVLIYFKSDTVLGLVQAFGRRLRPDGWLLLGHAEPNPAFDDVLSPVSLPGTVAYRPRAAGTFAEPAAAPAPFRPWSPVPVPEAEPWELAEADLPTADLPDADLPDADLQKADLPTALRTEREAMPPDTVDALPPAPSRLATLDDIRALADAGETAAAWRAVRAAIAASPTEAVLHYYDGLLAWSLGREAEAERALRGALYLDRDFVMAHHQLGLLLVAMGRRADAGRALDTAIRLGGRLPADALLPEGDGRRAGQVAASAALARAGLTETVT